MLDKTNTRFPTIREARLRAQWRENSKRYYEKQKLFREKNNLLDSIEWFWNQGDMVTEQEKEQNRLNIERVNYIIKYVNEVNE